MEPDDWSAQLRDDSIRRLEAIRRVQDELAQVYGEAVAARGLVTVRVTPAGLPTRLHLDAGATRLPAGDLAGHIMAAIGDATAQAAERMRAVVGGVVPVEDLDALVRGTVSEGDRASVREQLDALRAEAGAQHSP